MSNAESAPIITLSQWKMWKWKILFLSFYLNLNFEGKNLGTQIVLENFMSSLYPLRSDLPCLKSVKSSQSNVLGIERYERTYANGGSDIILFS